jgi:hypothetical protein
MGLVENLKEYGRSVKANTPPKHGDNEGGPNDSPTEEPGKSSDGNTHTALLFAIGRCHSTQSFVRS